MNSDKDKKATKQVKKSQEQQGKVKENYEPPKLMKFERLEKLIVSGE